MSDNTKKLLRLTLYANGAFVWGIGLLIESIIIYMVLYVVPWYDPDAKYLPLVVAMACWLGIFFGLPFLAWKYRLPWTEIKK